MARKKNAGAKRLRNSDDASPSRGKQIQEWFSLFSQATAWVTGRPATFLLAFTVIVVWAATGPIFDYSDTWQLVINTGTTIVTFLMVFLIQNTQYRDTMAIQLKLAELILALKGVPNKFAMIEDLSDEELEALHEQCRTQAETAREHADTALEHLERRKTKS
ncbi:MAG TPA: low affinity iron permease family protein [Xanthobacteraceae bacterium]|nr:low affinity iron permease family protein [Xanthobacteraceae bacterium]